MNIYEAKLKKPKCPRSPYMYFVKEYQQQLKKKNKNLSFGEASKMCAAKWKHLSDDLKEKYKKMSEVDSQRYRKEIQAFTPKQLRMLKRKKDPKAPLRPMSAYMWFCKQNWKKAIGNNPEKPYKDVMKQLGKLWAECDPKTREKYDAMAECDKKCYEVEIRRYKKSKTSNRKRIVQ